MISFFKRLFTKNKQAQTALPNVKVVWADEINPDKSMCIDVVLGFDIETTGDIKDATINLRMNKMLVTAGDIKANKFIDTASDGVLKTVLALLCNEAGTYIKNGTSTFAKSTPPTVPIDKELLN